MVEKMDMSEKEGCKPGTIPRQNKCIKVPRGWWPIGNGEIIRKIGISKDGCTIDATAIPKKDGSVESKIIMHCSNKNNKIIERLGKHKNFESGLDATLKWIRTNKKIKGG